MSDPLLPQAGFPEGQRRHVAQLYWQAFSGKLGGILGPEDKAVTFFARVLDPRFSISIMSASGEVLGVAGYKTREGGLVGGELRDLQAVYGWIGGLWRGLAMSALDRHVSADILLMDGIFVSPAARGTGIGGRLLDAIAQEARIRKLRGVRLDVIDTNPRAKALYLRKGFVPVEEQKLGPLKWIFGFSTATGMELSV